MPELSIIVPVYKVENYLSKCVDSILAQTFTDYELILIDDGSPDRCGEICDEYASKDNRIRVIHQENKGVSAARNAGLDIAAGTYIGFVDSDDWIEPEMYEKMMAQIYGMEKIDFIACARYTEKLKQDDTISSICFESKKMILKDLFSKPSILTGSCCNKLFRKSVFKNYRFREDICIWEDLILLSEIYVNCCTTGLYITDQLYHYRINMGSVTRNDMPFYGKKQYKEYIFKNLYTYSKCIASQSLDYFLDSSLQLLETYKRAAKIDRFIKILDVKLTILYWIFYAKINHLFDNKQIHRYIYEGVVRW